MIGEVIKEGKTDPKELTLSKHVFMLIGS